MPAADSAAGAGEPSRSLRRSSLVEGISAGLFLALCDGLAAGMGRVSAEVGAAILLGGLGAGVLGGAVAAATGRRGVALGLVAGGALFLHAGSTYTKSIGAPLSATGSVATLAVLLAVAAATGVVAGRRLSRGGGIAGAGLVLAAVPAASLAWGAVAHTPLLLCLTCAAPLAVGLAGSVGRMPRPLGPVLLSLVVAGLAVPSTLVDLATPRHHAPPPVDTVAADDAPNVVLVVVDTLRQDHAFARDAGEAPGLFARVAAQGVRFDQAIASAPWTLPSVASLFTSLHPSQHGAVTDRRRLADDVTTLAELMHGAGYETAAFTGGAFVSPTYGLDQGFEIFDSRAEYRFLPFHGHVPLVWRVIRNRFLPLRFLLRWVGEYGGVPTLAARVEGWLARRDRARPFFLVVHTYQVHDYYVYQPASDDGLLATLGERPPSVSGRLAIHPRELVDGPQERVDWYHAIYRHRVAYVERELGKLLATIEGSDERNLVTILTSDHGEGFDVARHRIHHGGRLHDDLLRVPLVLRAPGRVPAGLVVGEQVRSVDVMPTVLDLAGLSIPEHLAGRSLVPLWAGEEDEPRLAWSEQHSEVRLVSLRAPRWKLVDAPGGERVFRLDEDPLEDYPVDDPPPAALRDRWAERGALLVPRDGPETRVGGALLEQLRRIGY